jgi:hypothetical protein
MIRRSRTHCYRSPVVLMKPTCAPQDPPVQAAPAQLHPWASTGHRMIELDAESAEATMLCRNQKNGPG